MIDQGKPRLYIILVTVRYTHPELIGTGYRHWPVRIVAWNENAAQVGALEYAKIFKPEGLAPNVTPFPEFASTVVELCEVDCIGESVR